MISRLTHIGVLAGCVGAAACSGTIELGTPPSGPNTTFDPSNPFAVCTVTRRAPVFHRLNRNQYENTVNQILGTTLPLRNDLPPDSIVYGFDNGSGTALSAALTQQYLNSARTAVTAALASSSARAQLLPCSLTGTSAATCLRTVLQSFLPKAFRRPVTSAELDEYVGYSTVCTSSAEAGLSCALQAALISPKFLFRSELVAGGEALACGQSAPLVSSADGQLSHYELASRLSYLLWNSAPDDILYQLASSGSLSDPAVLAQQVDRMLQPAMLARFASPMLADFPLQWLQLSALDTAHPSATLFPQFDEPLRAAMRDESQMFFATVLTENRSALELVKADYSYLNQRLATHYGISNVTGTQMRKVVTAGTARGGLLTQGSFLTVTSSTENTSIVQRAKWVLKNLLCEDLPTPAPGLIDSVPAPDPGLGLTNRESLTLRTANQPCFGCHQNMNPIGFGLEIYDPVGAVRTTDHNKPIDASGQLPGAIKFKDTAEMLTLLRDDPRFGACLTKKLVTYALGRAPNAQCDQAAVALLAKQFKDDNYLLKNQLVRIIQSDLFRSAGAQPESP